jgi:peptide/nickel transport system substrate-binding protein
MLSLRYIIRLIQAFFKKFKAVIVLGIAFGVLVFFAVFFMFPSISATEEKIGMIGRFTPDALPEEITNKISSGLTTVDVNGNVSPSLAQSWESTDGGKTWIFRLFENKKWQDDKFVKSSDVNYEFNDASLEIIDDYTIKFNLDSQFSAFPIIVSKPIFKKGLLGTGDWKVKKITLIGGYVQRLTIINDKKDKITYKFYPTDERLKLAFKLGEVDILNKIQEKTEFEKWKTVDILANETSNSFVAIFFNTENEKFAEKTLRQAFNYAINKNNFGSIRALGPISSNSWAYNSQVKQYNFDAEKTKEVKDVDIKLATLPNLLKVAESVANDWRNSGAVVEVEVVSGMPENFDAFLATVDTPKDPDQYSLWHSTQTVTNISRYKNPRIDKLLEDGRTELDQELRKKYYLDFQRFLVEDSPAIFLYYPTSYTISRK